MAENIIRNIKFVGNRAKREEAISFVDNILKSNGKFDDYADLSSGFQSITDDYNIQINDDDDSYNVIVEPVSGGKEPLNFTVDKKTKTMYREISKEDIQPDIEDDDIDFLDEI